MAKKPITPKTARNRSDERRADIIRTVQTPLGFFVLVVLVVEAILAVIAGVSSGFDRTLSITGVLVIIGLLIAVVSFLAYRRPEALRGDRAETRPPARSSEITYQPSIDQTYRSMWARIEGIRPKPQYVWATYLNPDAFATGSVPDDLKSYYKKAERLLAVDYRRVFGVYPDLLAYREKRAKSLDWLREHLERTSKLVGYQVRIVELEFQAAEVLIDDIGLNFSFPSARATEAGWSTTDPRTREVMKDYFQQVWQHAVPASQFLARSESAAESACVAEHHAASPDPGPCQPETPVTRTAAVAAVAQNTPIGSTDSSGLVSTPGGNRVVK